MPRGKHHSGSSRQASPAGQIGIPAAPQPASIRTHTALMAAICAGLVIVVFAAFGGLRSSGFINYDDPFYVTKNVHVQKGLTGESVAWAFTATDAANWHPLTWLSHMLDVQLFGLDAGKHHLTSLVLHALNAVLLLLLLVRMTGALWRSAFVAALFALHPLHVESVAWIAERKDVLSTLFWLLTLAAWLAYVKSKKVPPYALALALFALGLMAKPMLVTLPFTLLLLDYWPLRRLTLPLRWRSGALQGLLWEKAPFFAFTAASCVITFVVQQSKGVVATLGNLGFGGRLASAALAYVGYLGKTIWPASLAVFYPHPHISLFSWAVCGSALLLAGITVLAFRLAEQAPYLVFGWCWYLGTLVPVIGLVQVGGQGMADRYTYMPIVGVFIAVAWGLAEFARRMPRARFAAPCVAAASLIALFPVTRLQTAAWVGNEALFEHALAVTSNNNLAHHNVGYFLFSQGRREEAIAHYREAIRIDPAFPDSRINLGVALVEAGDLDGAIEQYRIVLGMQPKNAELWTKLGIAWAKKDRYPEAIESLERALRCDPDFSDAHINLGLALDHENRVSEAVDHYRRALRINPGDPMALNSLGVELMRVNQMSEAVERLRQAVEIKPDFAEAHNNLGNALARQNRIPEAIGHYREALRIKPDDARALNNLGLAFGRTNRFSEAVEQFQKAVRINPDDADARFYLGIALVKEHRLTEAQEQLQQALRIKPNYEEASAVLQDVQQTLQGKP